MFYTDRNIESCQCVPVFEVIPMAVRELPVLEQPVVEACCAPLSAAVLSEPDAETLAGQFAALADPVRLRMVSVLANAGGPVCACDLVGPAGRSQGTVSWHLGKLREVGIVVSEKRGRNVWYAVNPSALEALRSALATG